MLQICIVLYMIFLEGDKHFFLRKKPIMLEFLIPYFTVSGIQVTEIVTKEEYEANGWVRCETKSGRYEIRK